MKMQIAACLLGSIIIASFTATRYEYDSRLLSSTEIHNLILETTKEDLVLSPLEITRSAPKSCTFMVFMAADNDLYYFALKNLKQMELGSNGNNNINIIVQLNVPGSMNPTKRYLIKNGARYLIQDQTTNLEKLNSGSPKTLIDFVNWAVQNYPAEHYVLDIWNHATGALEASIFNKTFDPCKLFYTNPNDQKLEIDRGSSFVEFMTSYSLSAAMLDSKKGVCFDDTFRSYLTNHDLDYALSEITTSIIGRKLDIILFDACLMSMIEIASIIKKHASFMVSSEEIVYGTGCYYDKILAPWKTETLDPLGFAKHIVQTYDESYGPLVNDYTFSALDLSRIEELEIAMNRLAEILIECLHYQKDNSVTNVIKKCKSNQYCTSFDEPTYKDFGHFCTNLINHVQFISLSDDQIETRVKCELFAILPAVQEAISNCVIANVTGKNLKKATGIAIYFPEHALSSNYIRSPFGISNKWCQFLTKYILK